MTSRTHACMHIRGTRASGCGCISARVHTHIRHPNKTPTTTVVMSSRGAAARTRFSNGAREPAGVHESGGRRARESQGHFEYISFNHGERDRERHSLDTRRTRPSRSAAPAILVPVVVVILLLLLGGDGITTDPTTTCSRLRDAAAFFLRASSASFDLVFLSLACRDTTQDATRVETNASFHAWHKTRDTSDCTDVAAGHQLSERRTTASSRLSSRRHPHPAPAARRAVPCRAACCWHSLRIAA